MNSGANLKADVLQVGHHGSSTSTSYIFLNAVLPEMGDVYKRQVQEMERRYHLFAENNVRDIKSFNKLAATDPMLEKMPYIAIIIDELALSLIHI